MTFPCQFEPVVNEKDILKDTSELINCNLINRNILYLP